MSIRIKCTEPTDNITLHSLDLSLNERTVSLKFAASTGSNGSPAAAAAAAEPAPKVKALSQDKELQYLIIKLDRHLVAGSEYVLGIDFVGTLNDDLAGFYKIKYETQNSSKPETT